MFFHRKKSKSGQVLQLLESYRNSQGTSTHRVVVSLGNANFPEGLWKRVATSIESKLYGQLELFSPNQKSQPWIDQIVKRIERENKWQPQAKERAHLASRKIAEKDAESQESEIVDGVLIDDVNHTHETTLGPELAALSAWKALEMDSLLARLGLSGAQRRGAACSVVNRLVDPVTENALPSWLQTSSLPDILGEDCLFAGNDKYYKISDKLLENQQAIENHISEKTASHFGLTRTYILYDLTNSHFEGECLENPKAKRGRNKQKRHDCPQIVAGVCFDEEGFVLFHKTFPGNQSDSASLLDMVTDMQNCSKDASLFNQAMKTLVVVDAGIATKDNLQLLRDKGLSYLVNETRKKREKYSDYFADSGNFSPVKKGKKQLTVQVRELDLIDGEIDLASSTSRKIGEPEAVSVNQPLTAHATDDPAESAEKPVTAGNRQLLKERLVLCRSEPRKAKELAIYSSTEKKFVNELEKLSTRIQKGRLKDSTKIERKIGRIQGCYPRASKYYSVEYVPPAILDKRTDKTKTSSSQALPPEKGQVGELCYTRKEEQSATTDSMKSLLGCYVLRTDRYEMSGEALWHLYMTLSKAENGFRMLKSNCGLRPNHHLLEARVDAHIFISILAYQLQRFILYQLEKTGDCRTWATLKRVLQTHAYSTLIVPTTDGTVYRIRKPGIPEECQRSIYTKLDIDVSALPKSKIVMKRKLSTL